jgi:hypothetical protein
MRLSVDVLREIGLASSLRFAEIEAVRTRSRRTNGLRMAAVACVPLLVLLLPQSPQNLVKLAQEEPWVGHDALAYGQTLADGLRRSIASLDWPKLDLTSHDFSSQGLARLADFEPLQAKWQAMIAPLTADVHRIGAIIAELSVRSLAIAAGEPAIDPMPVGSIRRPDDARPPAEASETVPSAPQPAEVNDDAALLREALGAGSLSPNARLALGEVLLERDQEDGLALLIEAADHDPRMVALVQPKVDAFAERHQFSRTAQKGQARLAELAKAARLALDERRTIRQYDTFSAPLLEASSLAGMQLCFRRNEAIAAARVAAKRVARWTELPAYVVVLDLPVEAERAGAIRSDVEACLEALELDGTFHVVGSSDPPAKRHLSDFAAIEGAVVYRRGG